jgi:hypothetical protein
VRAVCSKITLAQASWHGSSGQDWLEIDLQREYAVVKVVFYNRKDCCHSRAHNALLSLMDAARNVVNSAVLNSDVVQTFAFNDVDTCSAVPTAWRSRLIPHAAVFLSDSVLAVLSQSAEDNCAAQLHFLRTNSATAFWSCCVNVSVIQGSVLLFDRDQQVFSLLQGDTVTKFDSKGAVIHSMSPAIGRIVSSNAASSLETDIAVIVAQPHAYAHCNLFTAVCVDLVSRAACGEPVLAAAYGLHAFLKCSNSDDVYSSVIAGCEASSRLAIRLSGCVQRHSHFVSTMNLRDASNAEAEWLWAVSFRLEESFQALLEGGAEAATSPRHPTSCAQFFGVLTYIHAARGSGWLLQPSSRTHLDFLGIQHSIFDTISCIGVGGAVNNTAVAEAVDGLRRLHPWSHVPFTS